MTTEELIQLLAQYPGDLRVMVQGYEEGYDDLEAGLVVAGEANLKRLGFAPSKEEKQ